MSATLSRLNKEEWFSIRSQKNGSYCLLRRVAHVFEIINDVNKNWHNAIAVILQTSATLMPKQKLWIMLSEGQYHHPNDSLLVLPPFMFPTELYLTTYTRVPLPIAIPQSMNLNFQIKSSKIKIKTQTMVREIWKNSKVTFQWSVSAQRQSNNFIIVPNSCNKIAILRSFENRLQHCRRQFLYEIIR